MHCGDVTAVRGRGCACLRRQPRRCACCRRGGVHTGGVRVGVAVPAHHSPLPEVTAAHCSLPAPEGEEMRSDQNTIHSFAQSTQQQNPETINHAHARIVIYVIHRPRKDLDNGRGPKMRLCSQPTRMALISESTLISESALI